MSADPQPTISVCDLVVSYGNYVVVKGRAHRADQYPAGTWPSGRRNSLEGWVLRRLFHGDFVEYFVDCQGHRVTVRRPPTDSIAEGEEVTLLFSPEHAVLLER